MLNYIWGGMLIIGIIYAFFTGNMEAVSAAALDYAESAVALCITMAGIMGVWVGLMEIATRAGLVGAMTKKMDGMISFLFPDIPKGHVARNHIATNLVANILGLGWACTPAGLMAMEALSALNKKKDTATPAMCGFLILNISSLQLIPINMIAYRSQYGSQNPTGIILPAILATMCSTFAAILFILAAYRREKKCW